MAEGPAQRKMNRRPRTASSVPQYRVLEIAGVTILTASMMLDMMELSAL